MTKTVTWIPDCIDFTDTCQLEMTRDTFEIVKVTCRCSLHKGVKDVNLVHEIIEGVCKPRTAERIIEEAVKDGL